MVGVKNGFDSLILENIKIKFGIFIFLYICFIFFYLKYMYFYKLYNYFIKYLFNFKIKIKKKN